MKVWLVWVLVSIVAFGAGGRLGVALSPSEDIIVTGYLAIVASLLIAGMLQWMVLHRQLTNAKWWMPASLGAVVIIGGLSFGLGMIDRDVGWVLGVTVGWFMLGAFQWRVLHGQVGRSVWWVPANLLSLIVAVPLVGFVTGASGAPADSALGGFLRWLALGGAYGVVTGTALAWLLRQRPELV